MKTKQQNTKNNGDIVVNSNGKKMVVTRTDKYGRLFGKIVFVDGSVANGAMLIK